MNGEPLDFDALIIGAGIAGTTIAGLLLQSGLVARDRIAIIAERPEGASVGTDWDLRVFAINRAAQRTLQATGAWQSMAPDRLCAYERMCVWDARGEPQGRGSLTFDCAELGQPDLGCIVEGRALQREARRAAAYAGAVFLEASVEGLVTEPHGVRLHLSDGRDLRAGLLIAADGAQSKTRDLLGIETAGHSYHQDALVSHVATERPHRRTAWQRFLPSGPLALLPLPDGRSSLVWTVDRGEANRLRGLERSAFDAALTTASAAVLGRCERTTELAAFPLQMQFAVDYVRPRAVLIGDAAHVVHPLAGQGLNLGLMDCVSLVEALRMEKAAAQHPARASARLGGPTALRRYERRRRTENNLMAAALDALERGFARDDALSSRVRIMGLGAVSRLPVLKRRLAEQALGLVGGGLSD